MMLPKSLSHILNGMNVGEPPGSLGIPWIYRDPKAALKHWQNKIEGVLQHSKTKLDRLESDLSRVDLLPATKRRLQRLHDGHSKNIQYLRDLLGGLTDVKPEDQVPENNLERVPKQQSAMAYQATLFRDWAWGQEQVKLYAGFVTPFLKDKKRLAFLGAGACGLPLSVHNEVRPDLSVAVDINPLLMIPVKRLLDGASVRLVEFPVVASDSKHVYVEHDLKMQTKAAPGFEMMFCDAQNLPAKDGAFDGVVTSWFLDIVPRDFRETARLVNVVLEQGGVWANIGQLGFEKNDLTQIYGPDEIKEILTEAGFEIDSFRTHEVPYLQSPYDAVGRQDKVWSFSARKVKHAKRPATHEYWPEWLTDTAKPIPLSDDLRYLRVRSHIYSAVLELVDGQHSVDQIAAMMVRDFGLTEADAAKSVYSFFANFFEGVVYREF